MSEMAYSLSEGSANTAKKISICFGLKDVGKGLRRSVIIQVMTQAVTAEGNSLIFTGKKLEFPVVVFRTYHNFTIHYRAKCSAL